MNVMMIMCVCVCAAARREHFIVIIAHYTRARMYNLKPQENCWGFFFNVKAMRARDVITPRRSRVNERSGRVYIKYVRAQNYG